MLIFRNYRGDIDVNVIDKFMPLVMEMEDASQVSPVIQYGDVTFLYVSYSNLYCKCELEWSEKKVHMPTCLCYLFVVVVTSCKNANVAVIFQLLYKVVQVSLRARVITDR